MSWLMQLYETYEQCKDIDEFINSDNPLLPICHTYQNAHIEIVISDTGDFLRASVLSKDELSTIIPCTEASAGRSGSKPVNHPLCDKLQYLAGDFLAYGGIVTKGFQKQPEEPHQNYVNQLTAWVNSAHTHPKIKAIASYVNKEQMIADLVSEKLLPVDEDNKLVFQWQGKKEDAPDIVKIMPAKQSPQGAFVRWKVETQDEPLSATWEDRSLMTAWINYYTTRDVGKGLCMASGKEAPLAEQHPSGLRHGADKAKLISANDKVGYTFRGRFTDKKGNQACSISSEITQKAHNTLRWLIQREQAYRYGNQVFVAWAIAGDDIPDPFANTHQLFGMEMMATETVSQQVGDIGQAFAKKFAKQIAGYQAKLGSTAQIIVMGLDSATPGRMAITYYRELTGSDFLQRIEHWHSSVAWQQNYSKQIKFMGAPSPADIAKAAYGQDVDDKLRKATVERLLPCIIDSAPIPQDLLRSCHHRVCNRLGIERWEWKKTLGITCALVRGSQPERNYQMALETECTSRDYLYGRLLAIADHLEYSALEKDSKRPTSAARLMLQFSMHPYKTWKNIELALISYKPRIHSALLIKLDRLTDEVMDKFSSDDFTDPKPLSSEFLLAFHSQRKALWEKSNPEKSTENSTDNTTEESGA